MTKVVPSKLTPLGPNRAMIYLQKVFVQDSAFPFKLGDKLLVRARGKRLIVELDRRRESAPASAATTRPKAAKKSSAK